MLKSVTLASAVLLTLLSGARNAGAATAELVYNGSSVAINGTDVDETFTVNEQLRRGYFDRTGYHPPATYLIFTVVDNTGKVVIYRSFAKNNVSLIVISAKGGDDYIEINTDVNSYLLGGGGNDEIHGGEGDDYIDGGLGILDFIYGHGGNDTLVAGKKWSPPGTTPPFTEMNGGAGSDTFIYNNWDHLEMDDAAGPGWWFVPDYTYHSGQYAGMHVIVGG